MNSIKTLAIGEICLDLPEDIYQRLIAQYGKLSEFRDRLESFMGKLASHKDEYNINPYSDKVNRGIHLFHMIPLRERWRSQLRLSDVLTLIRV